MITRNFFLFVTLLILLSVSCNRAPITIKDYIPLSNGGHFVAFKQKFPFKPDKYQITITSYKDKERFYATFDQYNIFFEIEDYDTVQSKNDTIFVYTNYEPEIRIEEKRSYAFVFVEAPK